MSVAADHHLHEGRKLGLGLLWPFADRGILLLQRFEVEPGQGQERNSFRAGGPLLAHDLAEVAGGARLVERGDSHDPFVEAAGVACRAGFWDALRRILLRHLRVVLAEVTGVVIDDPRALLERVIIELWVVAVEAVELHDVARAALLVGDLVEFEICALMLLMAGRTREPA
ncbi:hypothetical protein [Hyphomicrobium sp. CS1GBMeth3]|uniref:hypothetical protein n=1 Tax=Hyphomicrobium sp. CS1GBMeth3 TaxID=1892845 RepID=UPI0011147011|nr:hypothetical protein [Hyphomicrobium sp. CS1GBMeth3]